MRAAGAKILGFCDAKSGIFLHRIAAGAPPSLRISRLRRGLLSAFSSRKPYQETLFSKKSRLRRGKQYLALSINIINNFHDMDDTLQFCVAYLAAFCRERLFSQMSRLRRGLQYVFQNINNTCGENCTKRFSVKSSP